MVVSRAEIEKRGEDSSGLNGLGKELFKKIESLIDEAIEREYTFDTKQVIGVHLDEKTAYSLRDNVRVIRALKREYGFKGWNIKFPRLSWFFCNWVIEVSPRIMPDLALGHGYDG
jgi:hypothetical protein